MSQPIRFYIFWKTEHQKLFNPNKILCLAFSTLLGHYIFKSLLFYFSIGSKGIFEKCIGLENEGNYLFVVISPIYNVLIIIVGVIADLTMYQNLKKREKIQAKRSENEPIPWKSGNHTESNLRIPLNATIISSCLLLGTVYISGQKTLDTPELGYI